MPRARAAARRAIEIAGDLAGAHAADACIAGVYEWNWREAAMARVSCSPAMPHSDHGHDQETIA